MKQFIKDWAWQILAVLFFVLYLGQGCTNNKLAKHDAEQKQVIDSLIKVVDNVPTKKEVKDEMEVTMLNFLIYEGDLDKGKTSLSEVKNKIEAND